MPSIHPQQRIQETLTREEWGILSHQGCVMGVDIGGYGVRVALVDLHNKTYVSASADMHGDTPDTILAHTEALARQLLADNNIPTQKLVRIGVGFGGPVDPVRGVILFSPRLHGWNNFSLKAYFEQAFDTTTLVDNDANLIALGEAMFGIGNGRDNLFYMHLSSGVGGGVVLNKRIYHGTHAIAGEVGHIVIGPDHTSTLEEAVSINGLLLRARTLGLQTDNLNDLFHSTTNAIGRQVIGEAEEMLAIRLAQVVALLDPDIIVLGGIVVRIGGDEFVQAIARKMNHFIAPHIAPPMTIVASVLGNESIVIGAVAVALESLND